MTRPTPIPPGPGQESAWDYPRPAICEPTRKHLLVLWRDRVVAETRRGFRALETSHPPTYYFPRGDVDMALLRPNPRVTYCEWKGQASYWDVVRDGDVLDAAAWSYETPTPGFKKVAGYLAFFPARFDRCTVDGEVVTSQEGVYYGGWITGDILGPFKGAPGSWGW